MAIRVAPPDLDTAARRTGDRICLHAANLSYARSVSAGFTVEGHAITGGRVLEIAPDVLRRTLGEDEPDI